MATTMASTTEMRRRCPISLLLILLCLPANCFSPSIKPFQSGQSNAIYQSSRLMLADNDEQRPTVGEDDAPGMMGEPNGQQSVADEVTELSKETKSWWKRGVASVKNGINTIVRKSVRKVQTFKTSNTMVELDGIFDPLRNTTMVRKLQEKYATPEDLSFARVEIFVDDFVMKDSEFDIDKLIAALRNFDRLLLENGTVWELASEFTGSWRISTTNTTLKAFNISLFPLVIPNLSIGLRDPDGVQLVKLYGDFEANTQLQKLEFRFNELEVLGIRRPLEGKKTIPLGKTATAATTATNATKHTGPFHEKVATNKTSKTMDDVLSWFDEWYDEAMSEELI